MRAKGPCGACYRNPAAGFASVWTKELGEAWLCHGDDDESPTCYEATVMTSEAITALLSRAIEKPLDPGIFMGDGGHT